MTFYVQQDKLQDYEESFRQKLRDRGYDEETVDRCTDRHMKENVVAIYTKNWQDEHLGYWIWTILNVPGGYWIAQDISQQPHVEFEHYRLKGSMSYEKGNVGLRTAKRELSKENYKNYKMAQKSNDCHIYQEFTVPKNL